MNMHRPWGSLVLSYLSRPSIITRGTMYSWTRNTLICDRCRNRLRASTQRRTRKELADNHTYAPRKELIRKLHRRSKLHILRSTHPPEPSQVQQAIIHDGERASMGAQRKVRVRRI
jgi:hypothetical protein